MTATLKDYLVEDARRTNVVIVKKKIYLNERNGGEKQEWSLTKGNDVMTLMPGMVFVGLTRSHHSVKWTTVLWESGTVTTKVEADFKPSEYDELVKLGALKPVTSA